ncbi:bacterial Cytochrome Ubiquinol Oxidase family protein [Klebsiella aerogenes]|nr:bacterial Cytochrome Ubiquinol Oxidase family protein [Klebsiella aerogenes]
MFGLDAFHLARIQFAFTVSFHIIFPAITIGLASYLAVLEGLWLKTKIQSGARYTISGRKSLPSTLVWVSSPDW